MDQKGSISMLNKIAKLIWDIAAYALRFVEEK